MKKKYFRKMLNRGFNKNNGVAIDYIDSGFKQGVFVTQWDISVCEENEFIVASPIWSVKIPYQNIMDITTVKL